MEESYAIFKKFPSIGQAKELTTLLNGHDIDTILDDNITSVDITFSGSTLQHQYEVRIKASDFNRAEALLKSRAKTLIDDIDKDYYLFEFTDDELYDVILKADEWNPFDYSLAQKILEQRGKPIHEERLKALKVERLEMLAQPEANQKPWIIAGYLFSFLGGFLGLIIGYFLWTSKKTLPNGQRVYAYAKQDRKHGEYIFFIGLIITPIALILKVIDQF